MDNGRTKQSQTRTMVLQLCGALRYVTLRHGSSKSSIVTQWFSNPNYSTLIQHAVIREPLHCALNSCRRLLSLMYGTSSLCSTLLPMVLLSSILHYLLYSNLTIRLLLYCGPARLRFDVACKVNSLASEGNISQSSLVSRAHG